jgi:ABC-type polysaccharide/polyol phosphate transport system ATPase subunit
MSEAAITLEGVTKEFYPHRNLNVGVKELMLRPLHLRRLARSSRFVAVDDVSFSVAPGETFGLLGRNGAGKSTLLSMIGGVIQPTRGRVRVRGRIAPLLEIGVGFVQDLSGIENAILNGVLLGLRRHEVEERLELIFDFAGVTEFAAQPLKTYSSGMQARLGFAIAIHTDPDVLLVDEVLAVGDAAFQEKCFERIGELRESGVTILFVSHDVRTVSRVCDRAAWIDAGKLREIGPATEVAARYYAELLGERQMRSAIEVLARTRDAADH